MLNKKDIKAILFDMDGTLTDTESLGMETMVGSLNTAGIKMSETECELFDKVWRRDGTDMTAEQFIHEILDKHKPTVSEAEFVREFYKSYELAIIKAKLLPGAKELLEKIKGHYKLALVTASQQSQAQAILKQHELTDTFDVVLSQDEYKIKKPDPASFLMAAKRLELNPASCVVIEDSKNGSLAGKNAGIYVIGVRAGNKHPQDLSSADMIVDTLTDLQDNF